MIGYRPEVTLPILWLYGADAVGKSTVAWEIYDSLTSRGVGAAYVDTDYLGFCTPSPYDDPSPLVAANLASMWPKEELVRKRDLTVRTQRRCAKCYLGNLVP